MIQNMRDLGGLKTQDGKTIKSHCLIRSAHLYQAEETDLEGISTIIDLRTPGERGQAPDQTWHCEYLPLPVFTEEEAGISHEQEISAQLIPDMAYLYGRLVKECTASLRKIMLSIMGHAFSTGAILWHCTEGKDRCGLTTALILEILGVDRKTIMDDYLKTNMVNLPKAVRVHDRLIKTQGKAMAEAAYQAYIADERYLKAAWDAMGDDYVRSKLGIDAETISRFNKSVLE